MRHILLSANLLYWVYGTKKYRKFLTECVIVNIIHIKPIGKVVIQKAFTGDYPEGMMKI